MKMKNCPYCNLEYPGGKSFGAHITNCKFNPKRNEIIKKISNTKTLGIKSYTFICNKCGKEYTLNLNKKQYINNQYKKNCSRKCANSHTKTEETKNKIRNSINNKIKNGESWGIIKLSSERHANKERIYCKSCNAELYGRRITNLCKKCLCNSAEYRQKLSDSVKGKTGGYKEKGGIGKQGWYNGIYCNSSWELAYVIYCKEHNIIIERNKIGFEYTFEDKVFKYYPDFIINGKYIEIKGYLDNKNKEKIKQFKEPLYVIDKKLIKPYIEYVINKYGKEYIKLYE